MTEHGMANVIAVVVTYNRKDLLIKCLSALKNQTHKLKKILIIDNASTDGTAELLKNRGIICDDLVDYQRTSINIGGAGGFSVGIKQALNKYQPNWVWLLDDDVEPTHDCLERLLADACRDCIIHPTRVDPDGRRVRWHQHFDPLRYRKVFTNIEFEAVDYLVSTNVACFEGSLISRKVLQDMPFNLEKFFIHEDDTLYGFLASIRFPVLYTSSALVKRLLPAPAIVSDWKVYYLIRNIFWLYKTLRAKKIINGINIFFAAFYASIKAMRILIPIILKFLVFAASKNRLKAAIRGFIDGLFDKPFPI